jgi:EAL domain-containing protein (putative c-di-GMP-specific phosphodiesterase class I)
VRLLVFDDDAAIGRLISRIATMAGFEAAAVTTALEFDACLQAPTPDVVALDLQLGCTDGVEQLRKLADRQYTGTLILISGYDERVLATTASLARDLGLRVEASLNKPIRVAELELVLQQLKKANSPITPERVLQALRNNEMRIELQPIASRNPNRLRKFEALIRWDHPAKGLIGPGNFIPIAEADIGVIDALTNWLGQTVIEAYTVLAASHVRVPISMNISTLNLHDITLPDRLEKLLREAGMPPHDLCLELTESAVFSDVTLSMDILTRARLKGMQLAIDDFGTGYSSFKLLRQMPFSAIKIDRSFIADLERSRDSQAITKSIVDLAKNMNMECIAEGVETETAAAMLEAIYFATMQGYHIAHPMPLEVVSSWLQGWGDVGDGDPLRLPGLEDGITPVLVDRRPATKAIDSEVSLDRLGLRRDLRLGSAAHHRHDRMDAAARLRTLDANVEDPDEAIGAIYDGR